MSDNPGDMDGVYWRALVEASPDIVMVVDASGTIQFANARTVGGASVIGTKLWVHGTGDAERRLTEKIALVVETKTAHVYTHQGYLRDGSVGWYDVRVIPVVSEEGRVNRVIWASADVSERVSATERLEASERRARALVEHGTDCISLVAADGTLTYASPGLSAALGYEQEDLQGKPASELVHPDDRAAVYAGGRGSPLGSSNETTLRARHKDGTWRLLEGTSQNLLHDPAVRAVVSNRRDVTARRRLEEQLRQSQKMEAIGLLAGGVAHDFNNLLAIILGFGGLAAAGLSSDHPSRRHLAEIEDAARRGAELTKKLLAFSRKQIMKARPLDVRTAVHDFTRMMERIVGEDVEIEVDRAPDPLVVQADRIQLEQVLMNLVTNARQAMPMGGRLRLATRGVDFDAASLEVEPWARAGAFAEIAVSDTGVGMDEATLARAFEPFFTTKREGTGLGLAMVYGIVEQHGGFVRVESREGQGTTVRVHLPRTGGPLAPVDEPRGDRPGVVGGRPHEAVLIAEDEPAVRALVATTLTGLGYRVTEAKDGEEAVRVYEREPDAFALVVLDVVMPRLGAREAYERMRLVRPEVRVLFTTGYAPASTRLREVIGSGAYPLLEKPFTQEDLAAAVREAIDRQRGPA